MRNLLTGLLESALDFASDNSQTLIAAAIALAIIAAMVYVSLPAIARLALRLRYRQPKALQKQFISLLSNKHIVELYEPANQYIEDVEEGAKRPLTNAWISPYARAVKASIRRKGRIPQSQYFDARKQIKEAAKHITIRPLNEDERKTIATSADDSNAQFVIELQYDGHNPQQIERLHPAIKSQLGLRELISTPDANPLAETLIASRTELEDALVQLKPGAEYFEEHPAKSPTSLPMALTVEGKSWSLPTHHTFIYGTTGSGKSGPLLATIKQAAPFVEQGRMKLYGIDPKAADLRIFQQSSLFESVVLDAEEAIIMINDLHSQMNARTRNAKIDLSKGETGQSFKATTETPWILIMIDELFALRNDLVKTKEGKAAWTNLENILAKGRSAGFYVIAASQFADQENLKNLRPNFANVIVLKQPSGYLNDLFLGEGAKDDGYDSTAIPASTAANGYKYSGIGFVLEEGSGIMKVRFAYIAQADLIELIKAHPATSTAPLHESNFIFEPTTPKDDDNSELSPFGEYDDDELPPLEW